MPSRNSLKRAIGYSVLGISLIAACKKDSAVVEKTYNVTPPTEVQTPASVGFFANEWEAKNFTAPAYDFVTPPFFGPKVKVTADFSQTITKVSKYVFGTNANTYIGQVATEPTLINHLKSLSPNVVRFPGGNISSVYFWNKNYGDKPADVPDTILYADGRALQKETFWYGKNTPDWSMSLENYYNTLQQVNSTGMVTVNYGYARYGTGAHPDRDAAHLAADWVRADNGRTKFWEIGNESSGPWQAGFKIDLKKNKDGQPEIINGTIYGKHFKVFADSMRKAAAEVGATIKIGAQLIHFDAANTWNVPDRTWNAEYFSEAGNAADYYIIHDYYTPLGANTGAADILNSATSNTQSMMNWMKTTTQSAGVQMKPIALTEWNIGAEGSKQMVSHVAGMHAAIVLGELIKNNYGMASRWGIANGYNKGNDHGLLSTGDDGDGTAKWTPRPAFYYMDYFQKYFGNRMFSSTVTGSTDVLSYASSFTSGEAGIVLVNKGTSSQITSIEIKNFIPGDRYYYYVLTGGDGGDFSRKVLINGVGPSGGPTNYGSLKARSAKINDNGKIKIDLPARSVVYLMIDNKK